MNIFSEVKDAVSTKDVASFYGIKINKHNMCLCPFHPDKHPSMKIDKYYYCFACGEKGDVINFVSKLHGLSPLDAAKQMIKDFNLNISTLPETNYKSKPLTPEEQQARQEKEQLRAFQLYKRDALFSLHRYYDLLHCAKRDLAPKTPEEFETTNPLFDEAVMNLEKIDWMIETLETVTLQEQIDFLNTYKEVIVYVNNRIENWNIISGD